MKFLLDLFKKKPAVEMVDVTRRFDLIGRIGQGSMSKVWRARDAMTGKMIALKILDREKTRRYEARFVGFNKPTEGEVALQLRHPNIVRTFEFGTTTEETQYLVMEFIEGVSLSYLIDVQNEVMRKNRLRFVLQIGKALKYFHDQNWIHRDICPRNVLLNEDYQVKLIDFGLVVPNTENFQKPGNRTGTANYMAAELIKRLWTDQRIDIFSYGVTCYEIYTKRFPWDVSSEVTLDMLVQHMNRPPKDIREFAPDIDDQIAEAIMKSLAGNPDDRWQTVREMLIPLRETKKRLEPENVDEQAEQPQ